MPSPTGRVVITGRPGKRGSRAKDHPGRAPPWAGARQGSNARAWPGGCPAPPAAAPRSGAGFPPSARDPLRRAGRPEPPIPHDGSAEAEGERDPDGRVLRARHAADGRQDAARLRDPPAGDGGRQCGSRTLERIQGPIGGGRGHARRCERRRVPPDGQRQLLDGRAVLAAAGCEWRDRAGQQELRIKVGLPEERVKGYQVGGLQHLVDADVLDPVGHGGGQGRSVHHRADGRGDRHESDPAVVSLERLGQARDGGEQVGVRARVTLGVAMALRASVQPPAATVARAAPSTARRLMPPGRDGSGPASSYARTAMWRTPPGGDVP